MTPETINQSEYDSIHFVGYLRVVMKKKYFIFFICVLFVASALIYSYFLPKSYSLATTLAIGKYGKIDDVAGGPLEDPSQIIAKFGRDVYQSKIGEKLQIPEDKFPKVGAHISPNATFIIFDLTDVASSQLPQTKAILSELDNIILTDHESIFNEKKDFFEKHVSFLEKNKENFAKDIQRIQLKIASLDSEKKNLEAKAEALQKILPYQQDPGTQYALFDTKEQIEKKNQEIENLYLEINSTNAQIIAIESQINILDNEKGEFVPTTIIQPIQVLETTRRSLIVVAIWGLVGLFAGIFFAFVREWWDRAQASTKI